MTNRASTPAAPIALTLSAALVLMAAGAAAAAHTVVVDPAAAVADQQPAGSPPAAAQPAEPPDEGATRRRRRPPTAAPPPPKLSIRKVASLPEAIGPGDALWQQATSLEVLLQPQTVTNPMLETATVEKVTVVALTDGKQIAWRFTWADAHPDATSETGQFSDAVGIQFPLVPGAPYLMGGPGQPVQSLYWRAQWQQDVDQGFQDVRARYPDAWSDVYWFAEPNGHHYQVPTSFQDARSHAWFIPLSAGNPMSDINRLNPVEETTAEGFGSLTHVPDGIATGRGAWQGGQWSVVITRAVVDDQLSKLFAPGAESEFALAVWDGGAGNVAGRKHHSLWVAFEVGK